MTIKIQSDESKAFLCLDCGVDTGFEYYMIHDHLWLNVMPDREGMLCVGCLEDRLGRKLCSRDFPDMPINDVTNSQIRTARLQDRLTRD